MEYMKKANEFLQKAILESEESELTLKETFKDLDMVNVLQIVNYWYNQTPDIFQNEDGIDLEEHIGLELNCQ
jgi:hypothetical protein